MELDDDDRLDPLLPAIVVGYRIGVDVERALRQLGEAPLWFLWWQHQYGGIMCDQVQLAGTFMRLEQAPATRGPREDVLVRLDALGCDGPWDAEIKQYREMKPLHRTHGEPYDADAVELLATVLARGFELPAIERAHEAFVELAPCDLLQSFGGWPLLERATPASGSGPFAVDGGLQLDASVLDDVVALGARLGIDRGPRAFLVWFNSD